MATLATQRMNERETPRLTAQKGVGSDATLSGDKGAESIRLLVRPPRSQAGSGVYVPL